MTGKKNFRFDARSGARASGRASGRASDAPSEHVEQRDFVRAFRCAYPDVLIFAIPNGGKRGIVLAQKLKLEGVVPGVPDLCIPAWRAWVEMKRRKGGTLSPEQKGVIGYLESIGYTVIVARGCEDGMAKIMKIIPDEWGAIARAE